MTNYKQKIQILFFGFLPLFFVFSGLWTSFDILALYWVEVIFIFLFAIIKTVVMLIWQLMNWRILQGIQSIITVWFSILHFGGFIIILCFPIGSFLPPQTETVLITDLFELPFIMLKYIDLIYVLPIVMLQQLTSLFSDYFVKKEYQLRKPPSYIARAYGNLMILFIGALFGLALSMMTSSMVWGAVTLILIRTSVDLIASSVKNKEI